MSSDFIPFIPIFIFPSLITLVPLVVYLLLLRKKIKKLSLRRKIITVSLIALAHFLLRVWVGIAFGEVLDELLSFFLIPDVIGLALVVPILLLFLLFELANFLSQWIGRRVDKKRMQVFFALFILLLAALIVMLLKFYLDKA